MSAVEESIKTVAETKPKVKPKTAPIFNRILDFLSSVRFGVVLLCIMVVLAIVGMLIVQQNVNGFDAYFASLTPAQKIVYGKLGLFDIYHSWYFNLLLLVLSLNIVLASIDRFPSAWSYISKPKLDASRKWLLGQKQNAVVQIDAENEEQAAEFISETFKKNGFAPTISEKKGNLYVFGESGKWNRLGAYIVHVALLTLFLGHFVALQSGFDADVRFIPGETTSEIQLIEFNLDQQNRFAVQLPFTITCTDIQQKLIDPKGSIETFNTLDWRTRIKINDPQYGVTEADVSLNNPFSYRGYRFFQAQTIPIGNARTMTLELTPQEADAKPISVKLNRNGSTKLPDGTLIAYESFLPDFTFNSEGKPDTKTGEYNNPAAVLQVTPKDGEKTRVFAFAGNIAENIPVGAAKAGYKWKLKEFEKVPLAHVLSIKYDPFNGAFIAWYFGGIGLIGALIFVFFISHRRVWGLIEKNEITDKFNVILGGNTNRNHQGFEDKFNRLVNDLSSESTL
ncbi:MAG: cytochrome c biogenesis protein ResB [Aridibacter sp.]